jgi:hypothetical protein
MTPPPVPQHQLCTGNNTGQKQDPITSVPEQERLHHWLSQYLQLPDGDRQHHAHSLAPQEQGSCCSSSFQDTVQRMSHICTPRQRICTIVVPCWPCRVRRSGCEAGHTVCRTSQRQDWADCPAHHPQHGTSQLLLRALAQHWPSTASQSSPRAGCRCHHPCQARPSAGLLPSPAPIPCCPLSWSS